MKVEFDEIIDLFKCYEIWHESREIVWYEKAWSLLDKSGLTAYENSLGRTLVIIRAFTLIMIYQEFCELAFDEYCSYDFPDWQENAEISAFRIGQLVARNCPDDDFCWCKDDDLALDAGFKSLVENERIRVAGSLKKIDQGGYCTVYVAMCLTYIDMADEEENSGVQIMFEEVCLSDLDKFEKDITDYYDDIVNDTGFAYMSAAEWLLAGTYAIR